MTVPRQMSLLQEAESTKGVRPKSTYAVLSVWTFVLAIVAEFLLIFYILDTAGGDHVAAVALVTAFAPLTRAVFFLVSMVGVIFAAVALVKKEPQKVKATVFGLLNLFSLVGLFLF